VMAWQYLQALPQIAAGASNKLWIIPAEVTKLLDGISARFGDLVESPDAAAAAKEAGDENEQEALRMAEEAAKAVAAVERSAEQAKQTPQ
ncbi:MAG: SPFH domain-containing protein, partial [Dehalococcoidia bacterium]